MNLLENAMTACVYLVESKGCDSDGLGGATPEWTEGSAFEAAFALAGSEPARRGERDIAEDAYDVYVLRDVPLGFHDVFRRITDGAVFRALSNGADSITPVGAALDLRRVRAERWSLPT